MSVTIASFTFDYSRGTSGYLRSTADSEFFDPDGAYHPAQAAGGRDYIKEIAFTAASNVATVPTFAHPATWDEASGAQSSVTFYVLDANRNKVGILRADFRIPSLPATTTWGALLTYNDTQATIRDTSTYTKTQVNSLISAQSWVGTGDPRLAPATTSSAGIVSTSAQTLGGLKTFQDGVDVPAVASDEIPGGGLFKGGAPAPGLYLDGARVAAPFQYLWLPDFNPSNASDWTTPINDAIALAQTLGNGHTIQLPSGVHNIDGPSLDPSGGNAQILLPEGSATQQFSLTIRGSGPPAMMNLGEVDSGTVLKSTPTSGSGSVMGVVGTAFVENRAILNINFEDLTFQMPPNPTRSALDLSHVTMPQGRNLRFWTGEGFDDGTGSMTEPTTTTSTAIKMPAGLAGQHANFGRIAISGFYRGIEWAELTQVIDANISNCHSAIYVNDAPHGTITQTHGSIGMGLVLSNNKYDIDVDPATTYHVFKYLDIDTERYVGGGVAGQVDKWFNSVAEVNDPNHALRGFLDYHVDYPVATFIADIVIVGGRYLVARPAFKRYWNRYPTEIFSGFRAQDNAVHEIRHGAATSNANSAAWLALVTNRTDNANVVGGVAFVNLSLATADKRIAQITGNTAGATDAGAVFFATRSAGGALTVRGFFDSLGNLELQTADKGLILTSPNGTRYVLKVSNAGALVIAAA